MIDIANLINTAAIDLQMAQVEAMQALHRPAYDRSDPAYVEAMDKAEAARRTLNNAILAYGRACAKRERERCAQVAEKEAQDATGARLDAARSIAAALRALD